VRRLLYFALLVAVCGLASCQNNYGYGGYGSPYGPGTNTPGTTTPGTGPVTCSTATTATSATTSTSTCTDPVTNISVTISPATVSVNVVTTEQFFVSITGGTNNVAIWQVNGTAGGDDTVGRIDSNGLYHAPANVPSPATVKVSVVSFEDQKVFATAAVTITPAPIVAITSPSGPVTVASGAANTVTFSATETGGTSDTILWYVGPVGGLGVLGGNATLGTITASGVYSPPPTPPVGSTVTVIAAAQDAPTSTATLSVTISGYSTSSLQGQFAFSMAGSNASGHFFRAGSFVADGVGHLNSVLEDVNDASGATSTPISTTGTYVMDTGGRGSLKFNDGLTPASFNFVLVNGTQLQIIGFDSTGTATGQANAQDVSAFSPSGLNGTYIFDFTGVHNSNAISEIGEFTADGAGNITGGSIDVNDNGALSQLRITGNTAPVGQAVSYASTYSVPPSATGRGTLTLATSGATLHFSFYVVSRGSARFVGSDSQTATGAVAGVSALQAVNVPFDLTSLHGNVAFLLAGSGSGGTYASAGSFSANGQGNITSVVLDENLSGTPNPNVVLSGVNYTVASNGRGTLTFSGGRTYVFYLGPAGTAVVQETDANHPNIASDGTFAQQQNASFAGSEISGAYAIDTSGLSGAAVETITGNLAANGAGVISSGAIDINTTGTSTTLTPGELITGAYAASSSAERGTLTLNLTNPLIQTRNFAVYVVSPTQVFILETDSGRLAAGSLLRQF